MAENDIIQMRIGGHLIGISGLKKVMMEMAGEFAAKPDEEIRVELFRRVSALNYIPRKATDAYKCELLNEFKRFLGHSVPCEKATGLQILVLGPGCYNCDRLESDLRDVMAEMNVPGEIHHITDTGEIGKYGVMGVPGLVVNGRVVWVGSVPPKGKVRQWLQETSKGRDETR